VPRATEKVTELTVGDADIGSVYVSVYLPGNLTVGDLDLSQLVSGVHQIGGGGVIVEVNPFLHAQEIES
jgi:hypothetical protein